MTSKLTKSGQNKVQLHISKKQEKFLEHVANGHKIVEAQKLSGIKVSSSNGVRMLEKWAVQFKQIQQGQGFSKPHIVGKLVKLLNSPLVDAKGEKIVGITVDQFKEIAKLLTQLLPESQDKPHVTQFVINRYDIASKGTRANAGIPGKPVIDVEPIDISDPRT